MTPEQREKANRIYRKLLHYFENKLPVYFRINETIFRVGLILDLSESKATLVLKENFMGEIPILLEDIVEDSINLARARK